MFREEDFEDIRPYNNEEINPAVKRIISNPVFDRIVDPFMDSGVKEKIKSLMAGADSHYAFQRDFTYHMVASIIKKSINNFTWEGLENLDPTIPYLFVANHRDIVLDSALFQYILFKNNIPTTEITFGSNLMVNQFVTDLGKVNRMFKVERGGNKKELLINSKRLSAYIRHTLVNKKTSIWIAQRAGRTKDGNDRTETGLLKMFNLSAAGNTGEFFRELNIVPLAISYEYEPCCAFKIREILTTLITGTYKKAPGEDLQSIITGITQQKGRVHLAVCKTLNESLHLAEKEKTLNGKINLLTNIIDSEIYAKYKLWPNNYVAWDYLNDSQRFEGFYSADEKKRFFDYMEKEIRGLAGEGKTIKEIFLKIYANPLTNALSQYQRKP
jgi:hypothetical protein